MSEKPIFYRVIKDDDIEKMELIGEDNGSNSHLFLLETICCIIIFLAFPVFASLLWMILLIFNLCKPKKKKVLIVGKDKNIYNRILSENEFRRIVLVLKKEN
jgi:hypothetical protein